MRPNRATLVPKNEPITPARPDFCSAAPVPISLSRVAFPSIPRRIDLYPPTSCLSLSFPIPTVSNIYHICLSGLSVTCPLCTCRASVQPLSLIRRGRLSGCRMSVMMFLYPRASSACVKFLLFVIYFDWDAINIASPCS